MLFKFSIFLLFFGKCMCCVLSCLGMSNSVTPRTGAHQAGSSVHGDSPGKNTGGGCDALLQGIFPTQGLDPGLPHHRQILYHMSHEGSPRILEWVAYPFCRGPSCPRNWTKVSCIVGRFFTSWATTEVPFDHCNSLLTGFSSFSLTFFQSFHSPNRHLIMSLIYLRKKQDQ